MRTFAFRINNTTIMEETKKCYYGPTPQVLNEDILSFLCIKNKEKIGAGSCRDSPRPRIRYVIDKNRFGYADFGDLFLCPIAKWLTLPDIILMLYSLQVPAL